MNRFALILVALLIGLVAATSCSRTDPALARADAVMEQAPDSALAILEAVDTAALRSERSRALYGLLLTQARVKCDVPVESDSLIAASARYFADHGPDSLTMRASFYKGWVNYSLKNYTDAIVPATSSYDLAIRSENNYWIAKSAELISFLYSATFYRKECIEYAKIAAKYYDIAGRKLNHIYALCDLGLALANGDSIKRGEHLLDSVVVVALKECSDTSAALYALSNIFAIRVYAEDYKRAQNIIDTLDAYGYSFNNQEIGWIAMTKLKLGNPPDITPFLKQSDNNNLSIFESSSLFSFLTDYYRATGNANLALRYMDSLLSHQNREVNDLVKQSLISTLNQSNTDKIHKEQEKALKLAQTNRFIIILSAIIIAFLLILWFYRNRLKNAALEQRMVEILMMSKEIEAQENRNSALSSDLTAANTAVTEMSQQLEHVIRDNWNTINNICDQYMQTDDSRASMSMLVKAIDSELAKMREDESIARMEHDIDLYMNGIVSRLRQECPSLKEDDVAFFCLICAGFTPRAVSLITGLKLKSFYTKKSRLIKRIEQSACPSAPDFLRALH